MEILSPATQQYDLGYKRTLYARHGVREDWLVDPETETVEVLIGSDEGLAPVATHGVNDALTSSMLPGLSMDFRGLFSGG